MKSRDRTADRTIHRSYRISRDHEERLRKEAELSGMTDDGLLNVILKQYFDVGRYSEKYGMVTMLKSTVSRMLREIPEDKVEQMGREYGVAAHMSHLAFRGFEPSYENLLNLIRLVARQWGTQLEEKELPDGFSFYATHNMGKKFGLLSKNMLVVAARELLGLECNVEVLENALAIFVPRKTG